MDALSIGPNTPSATPQATPSGVASVAPKQVAEARPAVRSADAGKPPAEATDEDAAPVRDSRSVQYMVQGNRVITTIVDDQSKKVVVQIPDAELIRIAKSIDRMQGFFIEEKA